MQAYIIRRLLALIPTLFFASVIVFVTVRMIPGDIIDLMLSQNDIAAGKMGREQLERALGLDQPMWLQYGRWVSAILFHGDFGNSLWQSTPVSEHLMARLPVTFELGAMALVVGLLVAIPIGVFSAVRQDTAGDYIARSFSILMLAVPSFWLGTMVMVFPSIWWGWSPPMQFVPFAKDPIANLSQMITPAIILGCACRPSHAAHAHHDAGVLPRTIIRTAWAKGLGEAGGGRHALHQRADPVVTLISLQAPLLIGGTR